MLKGEYRFYQEGRLIGVHKNLLTTSGKNMILAYLAGQVPSIGSLIVLGTGETAPAVTDSRLTFEGARATVSVKTVDYNNKYVIFKSSLDKDVSLSIYEAGIYNSISSARIGRYLTSFETDLEPWSNVTADSTHTRYGESSSLVTVGASATVSVRHDSVLDLSAYTPNDTFTLALYKPDNNITNVSLVFGDISASGTYSSTADISSLPVGYNVVSYPKSSFTKTGTVDWSSITTFGVDVTANATGSTLILDGMRVEDDDIVDTTSTLVSRSVLSSPIVKTNSAPMDVEYCLQVTFL